MIPRPLRREVKDLVRGGFSCEIIEDGGRVYVRFEGFPLPPGIYNMEKTDLLVYTTPEYPAVGFDMFWTDPRLLLRDLSCPSRADVMEPHLGSKWRRFSYHPYQRAWWNPSMDGIKNYVEHVRRRLREGFARVDCAV